METKKGDFIYAVHEKLGLQKFTVRCWDILGRNKRGWTEVKGGQPKEDIPIDVIPIPVRPEEVIPVGCCKKLVEYTTFNGEKKAEEKTEREIIIEKLKELNVKFQRNAKTEKLKTLLDENTK